MIFFRFSKIRIRLSDHIEIKKLVLYSITPLSRYHCKSQECKVQTDIRTQGLFYTKFNFDHFHLNLFLKKYVFLVASSTKWNDIGSFNNKYNNPNHINLLRALTLLCGETYAIVDLFAQNLTLNNFYSKRLFLPLPFRVCSIFFTWQWPEITPTRLQQ